MVNRLANATEMAQRHCQACTGDMPTVPAEQVREQLRQLPGWELRDGQLIRSFSFDNFHQTMAFVNAVAWVAHRENHHPDLEVGYRRCLVRYSTHAVGGITDNDLICAAKVSELLAGA